ncbi:MAG: ABC transporter ATP-binding protein [Pelolinea sp.]|nr:ABC transporter ATP-binding protein [Pelolinea sp.]
MKDSPKFVEMKHITKRFPGVIANDCIDLEINQGEIRALLGENGAGKTTLMNILSGLYSPDEGEIRINGKPVVFKSPKDAIDLGIGMVHQHFMLIETLSVTENIILGLKSKNEPFLDLDQGRKKISKLSTRLGFDIDPDIKIWQLSVGERQRVEITKVLYRGAKIIVLDEPTSVLTPTEVDWLFNVLRRMANSGSTIIIVTHKLKEAIKISDRITVLRDGKVISTIDKRETNDRELAKMMVGREINIIRNEKSKINENNNILEIVNISCLNEKKIPAVKDISFSLKAGEIFGIAGVAGNGQRELADVLTGLRKVTSGKIILNGLDIANKSPAEFIKLGIGYIPEDRQERGLLLDFSVLENFILKTHSSKQYTKERQIPFLGRWVIDKDKINDDSQKIIDEYNIKTPSKETLISKLSGGNQQKLVLARELSGEPKLLIASQPTMGLDIGALEFIHKKLVEEKEKGMAVLLISYDLDEIMVLSDRIAVIYEGRIAKIFHSEKVNIEDVGLLMGGAK